ncbi:PQQ-binding-like beta-propeller repeat protein [Actinoplanes bogorensis]|uniref:PQQ-binding-like beta-propeller repeat protein n=1 Tax=Paractinoplanes bogorensis TaxID=1610840 RepID=A0ABS5YGX2_9ACTN|nr:PQQ-binding-like beta-propeller repeat protein [Actinoplanes bogorensis]MBU2661953.1 PQQ-binding-like beta-propeller repeat protein [Actinoplanes bogorensis]
MSTIELGELPPADEEPEHTGSFRWPRRHIRQAGAVLATVLCAATLAGSAVAPEPHGVRPLWSIELDDAQSTTLSRDRLFVHRSLNGRATVTAYDLATGTVIWQHAFDGTIGYLQAVDPAGVILVPSEAHVVTMSTSDDGSSYSTEFHRRTVAISMATGAELWRATGEPYSIGDDTVLLTEYTDRADLARMRLVRLSDRSTIWTRETPGVKNQTVLPTVHPERIVTATATGAIKIFSYASGKLITSATVPWSQGNPTEGYYNDLTGTGELLVVNRTRREKLDMSVYRLDTMTELWKMDGSGFNGFAFPCGATLCVSNSTGLEVYDPVTGARRWTLDGASNASMVSADRLMIGDSLGRPDGPNQLVDVATGTPVGEPLNGTLTWGDLKESSMLLLRTTVSPPDRTAVVRWDLETGRQRVLGAVDRIPDGACQTVPGYLACHSTGRFQVLAVN